MQVHNSTKYETDEQTFPHDAYAVARWGQGIAFRVCGWETQPDEDTEWTGMETRTGNVIAVMIGDDRKFSVDPEDLTPIPDKDYCPECGQVGCKAGRV
jgi:hypothetical protein